MKKTLKFKKEARKKREDKIYYECYFAWKDAKKLNPKKYPEDKPALNRTQAKYWEGYSTYWAKCKYGHIAERTVLKSACPICEKISRSIRSAKVRGGNIVPLSVEEKNEIFEIYNEARKISIETNTPHHVDHIRPLAAGGSHHPKNLRIISAAENLSKGSYYNGVRKSYSAKEKKILRAKFLSEKKLEKELLKQQGMRANSNNYNNYLILLPLVFIAIIIFYF